MKRNMIQSKGGFDVKNIDPSTISELSELVENFMKAREFLDTIDNKEFEDIHFSFFENWAKLEIDKNALRRSIISSFSGPDIEINLTELFNEISKKSKYSRVAVFRSCNFLEEHKLIESRIELTSYGRIKIYRLTKIGNLVKIFSNP